MKTQEACLIQASHKSSLPDLHNYNNTIANTLPHYQRLYIHKIKNKKTLRGKYYAAYGEKITNAEK